MAWLTLVQLHNYRRVAAGEDLPAYSLSDKRRSGAVNLSAMSTEELWSLHDATTHKDQADGLSLLDIKIELAHRQLSHCTLCERRCGVDRTQGPSGFCGVGIDTHYFFEQILWGEEAPLIPSHEIFFSGCNLRCKYCYSWQSLADTSYGKSVQPDDLAFLVDHRRQEGALNVNLIGGEPTVHLPNILRSLKLVKNPTALVWNSNFLMSDEAMRLLDGVVDLYVGDFRFGSNCCAHDIGGVDKYFETASRNFKLAARSGDLIIRHLLMPGHIDCCLRPIAQWVAENLPDTPFNLMFQYTPFHEALNDPFLCRSITPEEEKEALGIVSSLGLNTDEWNTPVTSGAADRPIGKGEIKTTITIRPDGHVGIMHLHGDLLQIVRALENGG